ncbi:MAG: hypothetical protein M1837_003680 [Sclerophora amabilis]|nr:MAG: hypothetical protein M1837_003680 [Sclerophora amabilis]
MSFAFFKQHFLRSPQEPSSASSCSRVSPHGPVQESSRVDVVRRYFIRSAPQSRSEEKAPQPRGPFQGYSPSKESKESSALSNPQQPGHHDSPTLPHNVDLEAHRGERSLANDESDDGSSRKRRRFKLDVRVISDAIIGLSDGLTVPFALTAGLSTFGDKKVVIYGGLAELIAGAISMGLGGYLGAKSEAHSYRTTIAETDTLIKASLDDAVKLVKSTLDPFELPSASVDEVTTQLQQSPEQMLSYLMKFHHGMGEPASNRALISGATIASGYFFGGFIPLIPYFFVGHRPITDALWWSVIVMVFALVTFGYCKTCIICGWHGKTNVWSGIKGAFQMVLVGGAAAGAAMGLVKAFHSTSH